MNLAQRSHGFSHKSFIITSLGSSKLILSVIFFIGFLLNRFNAQCPVQAVINPSTVVCGDPVSLTAVPDGCKPLNNNFNDGTINASGTQPWASTNGANVENGTGTYSCVGPPSEGAYSLWMGTTVAAPRAVTTNGYDLTACSAVSATLCFDMKYGYQGGASPCEGIDLPAEGVYIQYSIAGGAWTTLAYYDPNGGTDPNLTSWRRYCLDIPIAALGTNTAFRWFQSQSSGAGFDAWGLDNMVINLNVPGYTFDWAHDAQSPSSSPATPNVIVTGNTTYTVTYTNGVETCTSSVGVTVLAPTVSATANPSVVCVGSSVQLTAASSLIANPPSTCAGTTLTCDPISTQAQEVQAGTGTVLSQTSNSGIGYLGAGNANGALRGQFILRAADLFASGARAGKFTNIQFDIAAIYDAFSSPSGANRNYFDFTVSMMCTNLTQFASAAFVSTASAATVVNPRVVAFNTVGWYTLFFDQAYDWDGTSNIIVTMCWKSNDTGNPGSSIVVTRHTSVAYPASVIASTNTAGTGSWNCASSTSFINTYNSVPNFRFGQCIPRTGTLNYSWTSNPAGFTANTYNPTATPAVATTYTVSVNEASRPPACAVTANVSITMKDAPTIVINPSPVEICAAQGETSEGLNAVATTPTSSIVATTFTTSNLNDAIPDGNTGCSNVTANPDNLIIVGGASPGTLTTNPIQSVTVNITCSRANDFEVYLISPNGTQTLIIDKKGGTGANIAATLIPSGGAALPIGNTGIPAGNYAPSNAWPTTGNVNGNWNLKIIDKCKPGALSSSVGTLVSWSIKFNAPNDISSFSWSPATNLSSTTTGFTTTNTSSDRTYTVTATGTNGCSSQASVNVTIGCVLPVELADYSLSCTSNDVNISWNIASQINNDFFTLERSFDGINYSEIATLDGAGNSSTLMSYNFRDKKDFGSLMNRDDIYYRLNQTDFDGQKQVIGLKTIKGCSTNTYACIETYPNPVGNYTLEISTSGLTNKSFVFQLHDMMGKLVYSKPIIPESDNYKLSVNLPTTLQRGMYMISSDGLSEVHFCEQKIIVQ